MTAPHKTGRSRIQAAAIDAMTPAPFGQARTFPLRRHVQDGLYFGEARIHHPAG